MSEIIKQINVDGVDYDIVSESAERKIAELEKNNTALASVTFGTRDDEDNPVKVGFGQLPNDFDQTKDIFIGNGVSISFDGIKIGSGSDSPIEMEWTHAPSFKIAGGYRGDTIEIGSDVIRYNGEVVGGGSGGSGSSSNSGVSMLDGYKMEVSMGSGLCFGTDFSNIYGITRIGTGMQIIMGSDGLSIDHLDRGFSLLISTDAITCNGTQIAGSSGSGSGSGNSGDGNLPIVSYEGTKLRLGSGVYSIDVQHPTFGTVLRIGTGTHIAGAVNIGDRVSIGTGGLNSKVVIGESLFDYDRLVIDGPLHIEGQSNYASLTIGTGDFGPINIDWSEDDKIVFTNLNSGKKATLTLS